MILQFFIYMSLKTSFFIIIYDFSFFSIFKIILSLSYGLTEGFLCIRVITLVIAVANTLSWSLVILQWACFFSVTSPELSSNHGLLLLRLKRNPSQWLSPALTPLKSGQFSHVLSSCVESLTVVCSLRSSTGTGWDRGLRPIAQKSLDHAFLSLLFPFQCES